MIIKRAESSVLVSVTLTKSGRHHMYVSSVTSEELLLSFFGKVTLKPRLHCKIEGGPKRVIIAKLSDFFDKTAQKHNVK